VTALVQTHKSSQYLGLMSTSEITGIQSNICVFS